MKFIADFHIHSHFSVATSKNLTPEHLEYWARLKGINVLGTGDCVHPGWLAELSEKLEPAENGLFRLKDEYRLEESRSFNRSHVPSEVFFILTGEISSIYKKNGGVRKVHNICVFPDFESVRKLQSRLDRIGNIRSDGRPILGLDSKIILEMVLETSPYSFLIPAHIWTPWFSVLGSKSGFNSIKECYDDLTQHIFAVETGLSSDPPMNWGCSFLDPYKLVSNSDAHSPEKLGREANVFDTDIGYRPIYDALKGDAGFLGTIEFFPNEGKYHYDGHRACEVRWDPLETLLNNGTCTACGKPVTLGVMYRVAELADRMTDADFPNKRSFRSITQLPDLLAEIMRKSNASSKAVRQEYHRLIAGIGSEFHILLDAEIDELRETGGELFAEGIRRLRAGDVRIEDGYDGEFGRIKVFDENELDSFKGTNLFTLPAGGPAAENNTLHKNLSMTFDIAEFQLLKKHSLKPQSEAVETVQLGLSSAAAALHAGAQKEGIEHGSGPCMIIAGPGSGKTRVLTERIVHLVRDRSVSPGSILALTFSNKAAEEMRVRINERAGCSSCTVSTFHAFGLSILREHCALTGRTSDLSILDDDERTAVMLGIVKEKRKAQPALKEADRTKQGTGPDTESEAIFTLYNNRLREMNAFDLADLIYQTVMLFNGHPDVLERVRGRYPYVFVDEFQDINARQYELVLQLADWGERNLFVIGDPDQAIYGFRGADVSFINRLPGDLPGMRVINLPASFRCPGNIMRIAGRVIGREKAIEGRLEQVTAEIVQCPSDRAEAEWISSRIEETMGGVRSFSIDSGIADGQSPDGVIGFSDFAILCRSSFMFPVIEESLVNHGIAYQVVGSDPFYRSDPYATAIARLKKLEKKGLISVALSLIIDEAETSEDGLQFTLLQKRRLLDFAEEFAGDYERFFRTLSLRQGVDDYNPKSEAVSLMTLHAAKGLEFNTVFIPGCEDLIIPFELFGENTPEVLAEEERLFYVGMTRTRRNLVLTHAKTRAYKGRVLKQKRSRFLDLFEIEFIKNIKINPPLKKNKDIQLDLFPKNI